MTDHCDVKPQGVARMLGLWGKVATFPGGAWLFSRLVGMYVPYSGSIGARVESLEPGFACITLKDRWRVRNHLRCVHAVALINLGELVSGMAMYASLPSNIRGIVVAIDVVYLKKARGCLVAESHCVLPVIDEVMDFPLFAEIKDVQGDIVAQVKVTWRLEARS